MYYVWCVMTGLYVMSCVCIYVFWHLLLAKKDLWSWVEFILRPTVGRPVRLGIDTDFIAYPFFRYNCFVVLPVGRPLWREAGSVTYSAIADWSGHWGPITIHYRLIWDCVPSSSHLTTRPSSSHLTTRRVYVWSILTRLHTGMERNKVYMNM
jgi:hypothetical protein